METVEVVIRIPKNLYEDLTRNQQEWAWCAKVECNNLTIGRAFRNGTLLPKGHGRLGDLDGIIKRHCFVECKGTPDCQSECEFFDRINDAPTVIEADKEVEDG